MTITKNNCNTIGEVQSDRLSGNVSDLSRAPIPSVKQTGVPECLKTPEGRFIIPFKDQCVKNFRLTDLQDNGLAEHFANEALNIAGAVLNVYKLLGVHEQSKLIDQVGLGKGISGGDANGYPAENAFDAFDTEWRSIQTGYDAITSSAYIGYDFGEIQKISPIRDYGNRAFRRKLITALGIKQSSREQNRVTRIRIERSDDGIKWYGVDTAELPNDNCLNIVYFKSTVSARYWRIRPLNFLGGKNDYWGVVGLQLYDNHERTHWSNIEDKVFLENRNKEYAKEPLEIRGYYDLVDVQLEINQFGSEAMLQLYILTTFQQCVEVLGRPIVIGDIIEIPSEAQYNPDLRRVRKWMEVTDVAWSTEGYTPGWQPVMLRIVALPALATQETQDIFGDLAAEPMPDELNLMSGDDGQNPNYQDYTAVSHEIENQAGLRLPERGTDANNELRAFSEEDLQEAEGYNITNLQTIGLEGRSLYVEDAMPPNGAPFTEGPEFPENPKDGDYHRLTYEGLAGNIPARLYRYSASKGRWVYLETDKRSFFSRTKPILQELLTSPFERPNDEIIPRDET